MSLDLIFADSPNALWDVDWESCFTSLMVTTSSIHDETDNDTAGREMTVFIADVEKDTLGELLEDIEVNVEQKHELFDMTYDETTLSCCESFLL